MTLATFYPFTQTGLYQQLRDLNWPLLLIFLMIATTILMVSQVKYATFPRFGFHSLRGILGAVILLCILFFGIYAHDAFLFPLGIAYMTYGLVRAAALGLFEETRGDEEAEIAGPIVIGDADRVDDAFGPRSHGITPRGRT
jgi:phosphatidylserine synthase